MRYLYGLLLICLIGLAGCASTPLPKQPAVETTPVPVQIESASTTSPAQITVTPAKSDITSSAILSCETYSKSDAEGQKKLFADTQQILSQNKQDSMQRIRLACMYALPSSYAKDSIRAQTLLQQLREDQTLSNVDKAYVNHLLLFNAENIKQQQKIKEEAKSLDNLNQKYDQLQKKFEANEQKLLQLKNIEKTLKVR